MEKKGGLDSPNRKLLAGSVVGRALGHMENFVSRLVFTFSAFLFIVPKLEGETNSAVLSVISKILAI